LIRHGSKAAVSRAAEMGGTGRLPKRLVTAQCRGDLHRAGDMSRLVDSLLGVWGKQRRVSTGG